MKTNCLMRMCFLILFWMITFATHAEQEGLSDAFLKFLIEIEEADDDTFDLVVEQTRRETKVWLEENDFEPRLNDDLPIKEKKLLKAKTDVEVDQ